MVTKRIFGEITGVTEGALFSSYAELNQAKVHTQTHIIISAILYLAPKIQPYL